MTQTTNKKFIDDSGDVLDMEIDELDKDNILMSVKNFYFGGGEKVNTFIIEEKAAKELRDFIDLFLKGLENDANN